MTARTPSPAAPPGAPAHADPYPWRVGLGVVLAILLGVSGLALLMGVLKVPWTTPEQAAAPSAAATAQVLPTAAFPTQGVAQTPPPTTLPAAERSAQPTLPAAASPGQATPVQAPAAAPTPQAVADPRGTGAQGSPTSQAVVDPNAAEAALKAYLAYWDVRVRAMADPSATDLDLESVMAGVELARAREVLGQWSQEGRAYRTEIDHQVRVATATPGEAVIFDQYVTTSIRIDPATKEPLGNEPAVEQLRTTFVLQKIGGTFKVADQRGES